MSQYAIIQLAGKQYRISEGEKIIVDRLPEAVDNTFTVNDVLMIGNDTTTTVGTPLVEKAAVTLKVVSEGKGKKIRVAKYKAKSRYRRVQGHRQLQSLVEVVKITA